MEHFMTIQSFFSYSDWSTDFYRTWWGDWNQQEDTSSTFCRCLIS